MLGIDSKARQYHIRNKCSLALVFLFGDLYPYLQILTIKLTQAKERKINSYQPKQEENKV